MIASANSAAAGADNYAARQWRNSVNICRCSCPLRGREQEGQNATGPEGSGPDDDKPPGNRASWDQGDVRHGGPETKQGKSGCRGRSFCAAAGLGWDEREARLRGPGTEKGRSE